MFKIALVDTDSCKFSKADDSFISKEERKAISADFRQIFPKFIDWEDDGYFTTFIVAKAKNYLMIDESGKMTKKGSAFKSSKLEPTLKEFQQAILNAVIEGEYGPEVLFSIYARYVKRCFEVTDIKEWASRKTMTDKVMTSKRKNETTIKDAAAGKYSIGDKFWVYYAADGRLRDVEDYAGDHDVLKLLKKLHSSAKIFKTFLEINHLTNFSLKTKQKVLQQVLTEL